MALLFKNAKIFAAGYDVSGQHNQVALEYSAAALDETVFGHDSTRMKGGLKTARMSGSGFWRAGNNEVDKIFFESLSLSDIVLTLFPDGITEGATSTGSGYAFKAELLTYNPLAGEVGSLLPFTIEAEGRGVQS